MNDQPKLNSDGWGERSAELTKDKHVRAQVERIMEPLRLIRGTRDVRSFEEVLNDVAQLIALLELNPHVPETANVGGVKVCRGPMEGYSIMVHAADVFVMHMGDLGEDAGGGKWRKAQQYWRAGQEARS